MNTNIKLYKKAIIPTKKIADTNFSLFNNNNIKQIAQQHKNQANLLFKQAKKLQIWTTDFFSIVRFQQVVNLDYFEQFLINQMQHYKRVCNITGLTCDKLSPINNFFLQRAIL